MLFLPVLVVLFVVVWALPAAAQSTSGKPTWRSKLYPENWEPGYADAEGRFIQDFSFAGYHSGTKTVPSDVLAPVVDVTAEPYNADNSGTVDATDAIQKAIDSVSEAGGGTVYLSAGTYSLKPQEGNDSALTIRSSNVRLMGDGPEQTFLRLDTLQMRFKHLLLVQGEGEWTPSGEGQRIAADLTYPTQIIPLAGKPQFQVGDWVIVTHDKTEELIKDLDMELQWEPGKGRAGKVIHYRRVIEVREETNSIVVDVPTRFLLLPRDNAAVYPVDIRPLEEVGLSGFAIGMPEHPKDDSMGNRDWKVEGSGAYEVHGATAIKLHKTTNCWVRDIKSYKLEDNERYWTLSMGVCIVEGRCNTVADVEFRNPQLRGGSSDGYMFWIMGSDNLVTNCAAYNGRHNFAFELGISHGNVLTGNFSYGRLPSPDWDNGGMTAYSSDFHFQFSPSNLVDNMTFDGNEFVSVWRGSGIGPGIGFTSSQSVFWNSHGLKYPERNPDRIITSEQAGWGYVIGTRGPAYEIALGNHPRTLPIDYCEGVGESETLEPQSLYEDQLKRRLARPKLIDSQGLDFRPRALRVQVNSPRPQSVVQGQVPLEVLITVPTGRHLTSVFVKIDDKVIYMGDEAPKRIVINTTLLTDGNHRLVTTARTDEREQVVHAAVFSVSN